MGKISFGTEGYRGIIGYNFNFQVVERITKAIAEYIKQNKGKRLLVGYDTRFLSKEFAEHAANTASKSEIDVLISDEFCPSPVLSNATRSLMFNGGIMITASHNPPKYNGIKFKSHYGGAVPTEVTDRLTELISKTRVNNTLPEPYRKGIDIKYIYKQDIERFIDRRLHSTKRLKIVVDPMYGSGQGLLADIFKELGHEVIEINNTVNPYFGGINPEPIDENLTQLKQAVLEHKADIGIALDGDADRIALVNGMGEYVDAHRVFGLLIMYLVEDMGLTGGVAKTVSSTEMINKLCEHYHLKLYITKIGFKHICELMQRENVMIGGEESGGIGISSHIPERDGLLAGILVTQMMLKRKKSLQELIELMYAITGKYFYKRRDIYMENASRIYKLILNNKDRLLGNRDDYTINDMDGYKFEFKNGGFIMVRASGTEPVLRIYAELNKKDEAEAMVNNFINKLKSIGGDKL
ncbi:MAG: phosphoglucomutase/phosphomannomutase family protein [bacterium]